MLIDLRNMHEPLVIHIRESLNAFLAKEPETKICTVALWGDGFHGTASLHLDTPDHSAAFAEKWNKDGPDWYGEDEHGRFCNSCWDMPHCIGEYGFPGYPDLYQVGIDDSVDYIALDGTKLRADASEGDEGKNRIVFPFLKDVISAFEPFGQLHRAVPFRVGVQMRDSKCEGFWLAAESASSAS